MVTLVSTLVMVMVILATTLAAHVDLVPALLCIPHLEMVTLAITLVMDVEPLLGALPLCTPPTQDITLVLTTLSWCLITTMTTLALGTILVWKLATLVSTQALLDVELAQWDAAAPCIHQTLAITLAMEWEVQATILVTTVSLLSLVESALMSAGTGKGWQKRNC